MTTERDSDPTIRRAQRVLLMVHELHKRGYQRLRIAPGLSPSGGSWRCCLTPKANTLRSNGAKAKDYGRTVKYSTANGNEYFGWRDATPDTARQLADKFIERFPSVLDECEGQDWEYCGWFVQVLGMADRRAFPPAYYESWDVKDQNPRFMYTSPVETNELPFPPTGDAND